jgi:hypothetical protein
MSDRLEIVKARSVARRDYASDDSEQFRMKEELRSQCPLADSMRIGLWSNSIAITSSRELNPRDVAPTACAR